MSEQASTFGNWPLNGFDRHGSRFSDLSQISRENVSQLQATWHYELDAPDGLVATPIVVNGIVYVTTAFSIVHALDAATGKLRWRFNPEIKFDGAAGQTDATFITSISARTNRGVAVWNGKVFVTVADCRLIALDAESGSKLWEKVTCDVEKGFAITAAPQVGQDMVFVGNGNSESGLQTRGHVDAYSADSGDHLWRFYTAPSHIDSENDTPAQQIAAETWSGSALATFGGGANAWDDITYDDDLDLLYFGTAAALPEDYDERSPHGGDNLFTLSVVALDASSGEYQWHYQAIPQDYWGYDLCTNIILANLPINGTPRNVLMIAPKSGFFYVIDRKTGELLSADKFARVNWASHVDKQSGRPVLNPDALSWKRERGATFDLYPNPWGAHTWIPMSYSPDERLAFIPVNNLPLRQWTDDNGKTHGKLALPRQTDDGQPAAPGSLVAWDVQAQSVRWSVDSDNAFDGGTMAGAGGLVFQGTASGHLNAHHSANGELLWSYDVGVAISAPPVSFMKDGDQFILLPIGGGGHPRFAESEIYWDTAAVGASGLVAFKLGETGFSYKKSELSSTPVPQPLIVDPDPASVAAGKKLYHDYFCYFCHGRNARGARTGTIPDLRRLTPEEHGQWHGIVVGGSRQHLGMPMFKISLDASDAIQSYIIEESRKALSEQQERAEK